MKKKTNEETEGKHPKTEVRVKEKTEKQNVVGTICKDEKCPIHGRLKVRGRVFEGRVMKKFPKRVVIEFERMIYSKKYERYYKSKTKIHARLPTCIENEINVGDLIRIQECRPLSKIIHFVVIKKIKGAEER